MRKYAFVFIVIFSLFFYSCSDLFESPEPPDIEGIWNYEFRWTSASCNVDLEDLLVEGEMEVQQFYDNITFVFYKNEDKTEYTLIYGKIDLSGNMSLRGIDDVNGEDYYYTLTLQATETYMSGDAQIEIKDEEGEVRCTVSGLFAARYAGEIEQ